MESRILMIFIVFTLLYQSILTAASYASQEELAAALLHPSRYDKKVRPTSPTIITLDMFINGISSISEVSMDLRVNMYLRQRWNDPRLKFNNSAYPDTLTLNWAQFDDMWVPDLFFKNEKSGVFHTITVPNRLIKFSPNGDILFSQRISVKLNCDMTLHKYPKDSQECAIELETYGFTTQEVVFKWNEGNPVQVTEQLTLPEFNLTGTSTGDCTATYVTGSFSCQYVNLHLTRLFAYYLIQVYIPSMLIVVLSWVSFWIDSDAVPARITLGLLTVLTITTQSSGISAKLPRVSYIKAIDIWMFTCMIFVFGALLEYSIVNVLARKDKEKQALRKEKEEAKLLGTKGSEEGPVKMIGEAEAENNTSIGTKIKTSFCLKYRDHTALFVDTVSRGFFPGAFLIFNICYWVSF